VKVWTVCSSVADGVAAIRKGAATVQGGTLNFAGQVRYAADPPEATLTARARGVRVVGDTRELIARTAPIFAGVGARVSTEAAADLELTARGRDVASILSSLGGTGEIACSAGEVAGSELVGSLLREIGADGDFRFEPFRAGFAVRDGSVLQDPFVIRTPHADLRLGGVAGLDGSLDFSIGVKPRGRSARNFRRYARILDSGGYVPFAIRGGIRAPSLVPPDPADLVDQVLDRGVEDLLDRKKKDDAKKKDPPKKNGPPK